MRSLERWGLVAGAIALVVVLPVLNALPPGSPLRVSDFTLNSSQVPGLTRSSRSAST